jgi:ketosteroid isomerase-like protein
MTLEERIKALEDIEQIKKLHITYVNNLIKTDWDGVLDCFTEDCVLDLNSGRAEGKDAVSRHFRRQVASHHIGKESPFVTHPLIEVDGDTATGTWLMKIEFALPRKMNPGIPETPTDDAPDWVEGFHEMEYVRVNGNWKIKSLYYRTRVFSLGYNK